MSCRLRQLRAFCGALLGLAAVLGGGACAGTPLPEPPDALPRPEFTDLAPRDSTAGPVPAALSLKVFVQAAAVPAGARPLVINLDDPALPVVSAVLGAGAVYVADLNAAAGDRVRVLFASDVAHSAPLDLVAVLEEASATLVLSPLGDTSLGCLELTPRESLVLSGTRGELTLSNACNVAVDLTRAALRTGFEGMRLAPLPSLQVAAGARVKLVVEDTQGAGTRERLDVLLLDVAAADGRTGRYAIDVFSDLE